MARAAGVRRLAAHPPVAGTESVPRAEGSSGDAFDGPVEIASPGTRTSDTRLTR